MLNIQPELDFMGNLQPIDKYPRRPGPVIRENAEGQRGAVIMEWGHPYHRMEGKGAARRLALKKNGEPYAPSPTSNIRHPHYPMFREYLTADHRCLIPTNLFAEPNPRAKEEGQPKNIWFGMKEEGALFAFAGIWRPWDKSWIADRKDEPSEVYAFLTCQPNQLVEPYHPKAMPVILKKEDWETWLTAPWTTAKTLQKPFPAEAMQVVAPNP